MAAPPSPRPPWGAFPAEQYLIRHWDWNATLPAPKQREQLIRAFLALDQVPLEWDRIFEYDDDRVPTKPVALSRQPTEREVRIILQPWRPESVRRTAVILAQNELAPYDPVFLRTHYEPDQNAALEEIIDESELAPALKHDWLAWVLDDEVLFRMEPNLEVEEIIDRVALVVPEMSRLTRSLIPKDLSFESETIGKIRAQNIARLRKELTAPNVETDADRRAVFVESESARTLQGMPCWKSIAIIDEETFRTKRLCYCFLDTSANLLRVMRIYHEDVRCCLQGAWEGHGNLSENVFWVDCNEEDFSTRLGRKYRPWAELGQQLYEVKDLLGPDPEART